MISKQANELFDNIEANVGLKIGQRDLLDSYVSKDSGEKINCYMGIFDATLILLRQCTCCDNIFHIEVENRCPKEGCQCGMEERNKIMFYINYQYPDIVIEILHQLRA